MKIMKRLLGIGMLVSVMSVVSAPTFAEEAEITRDTMMEVILFNKDLRAAMAKHVPDLMNNPDIDQASVISLGELAGYVPDQLTDKVIDAILADLNKVGK